MYLILKHFGDLLSAIPYLLILVFNLQPPYNTISQRVLLIEYRFMLTNFYVDKDDNFWVLVLKYISNSINVIQRET